MRNFKILALLLLFIAPSILGAMPTAKKIVEKADLYRGLQQDTYIIKVTSIRIRPKKKAKKGTVEVLLRKENASGVDKAIVKFLAPAREKGRAILEIDKNSWFHIPKTKKLIRITPSQKVLGEASTGDIAGTKYKENYSADLLGEERVEKKDCYYLKLSANNSKATYDKIEYWVEKKTFKPVKAKYFTISGKLMKMAYWKSFKTYRGREMVEKLLIADPLIKGKYTLLINDDYQKATLPASLFRKENLNRL